MEVEQVVEAPVAPVIVKPPVKLKKIIQPTDKEGQPIGQPHVYYYTDEADLQRQLSETVINGSRRIYELKLGTPVKFEVPEGAEMQQDEPDEEIPEFKPRELTADEKFAIAAKMRDPATIVEGFDQLQEARTGAKPEVIAKVQNQAARNSASAKRDAARVRARTEALAFQELHPEFVTNPANSNAMITYLNTRNMPCTLKNFELAFTALKNDELLILQEPEPEPEVKVVQEPKIEPAPRTEEAPTRIRGTADLPSAISRTDSSPSSTVRSGKPSARQLAMMNAAEYKAAVEKWPELR